MILNKKQMTEEDIKLHYITPAIQAKWGLDRMTMETKITDGRINLRGNITVREKPKKADYVLYLHKNKPIAIVEAKDNNHTVSHGLQQAMTYALMQDIPFAYSSNGDGFQEHDFLTGKERTLSLDEFPTPEELTARWEKESNGGEGISDNEKKVIEQPYYSSQNTYDPRYYQRNAINRTVEAIAKGQDRLLLVMATGTGKTWTAIYSAKRLLEENKCLIVIAAPYKHLVRQWAEDVNKLFPDAETVLISSENPQWYTISKRLVLSQQYHPEKQIILITTIKSFYSAKFEKVINLSDEEKLLIVDEAHRFTQRPENLRCAYSYMLGLSATPINGKQNENGIALLDFFGGLAYNLPIEEALERNFLVHYNYFPVYVTATSAEEENFNAISSNMAGCFRDGVLIDRERFVKYVRARLRIMGMAEEKLARIKTFVDQIKEKDHFVVYCGDGRLFDEQDEEIRHIQFVQNQMDDMGIRTSQFTANENMDRRMELVDMFNKQEIDALVAIRCLDEGINIPSIKSALILSSNDDYREFVQRRGRILRKYKGKKSADIYDVVVLPSAMCPKMAIIELRRYYEYAKLALNKEERLAELQTLLSQYGLRLEDIMFNTDLEVEVDLDE